MKLLKFGKKKSTKTDIERRMNELQVPSIDNVQLSAMDETELNRELTIHKAEIETYKAEAAALADFRRTEIEAKKGKNEFIGTALKLGAEGALCLLILNYEKADIITSKAFSRLPKFGNIK